LFGLGSCTARTPAAQAPAELCAPSSALLRRWRANGAALAARACWTRSASSATRRPRATGLHVHVRLVPLWDSYAVRAAAVAVARELERRRPDIITVAWWKEERGARILIDYNQNAPHRTVFGAWRVRARLGAQVTALLHWEEVFELHPDDLTVATVIDRLDRLDDPWKDIDEVPQSLEPMLAMHERDRANGLLDAPWPPVYPNMPDEPPRVAPSRAETTRPVDPILRPRKAALRPFSARPPPRWKSSVGRPCGVDRRLSHNASELAAA
jgi:hypothetical protein